MEKEVVDAHINLYVNNFSVSLGEKGRKAVEMVFEKAGRDSGSVFVKN
jgi:predicted solute-binding protein